MTRLLTMLVVACLASQQVTHAASYSREDFVRDRLNRHAPAGAMDAPTLFALHYAGGFVAGVVDATEGRRWCARKGLADGELDEHVGRALNRGYGAPAGSAAKAILAFLKLKYPCKGKRTGSAPRLLPPDFVRDYNTTAATHKQGYAAGYLDGVLDATRGDRWCAPAGAGEQGLILSAVANIGKRNLPPSTSAARSMLRQLGKQSPCKRSSTRKEARDGHQSKDADRKAQSRIARGRHARGGDVRKPGAVRGRSRTPVPGAARTGRQ